MKTLLRLSLLLLALPPLSASADADRSRRGEEPRVILYSGENFDGVAIELSPRSAIPDLGELRFSDGRAVNPEAIVAICEKRDLILQLTRFTLHTTLRQMSG